MSKKNISANIIEKVTETIKKHSLIKSGDKILVGLSGGADSVALLHILKSLSAAYNITVYAAHINHNMRDTAVRDMEYSKKLCDTLGIECFIKSADVPAFAAQNGLSSEEAGRKIRYGFFNEICALKDLDKIATAHNLNDCAETILMNFIRGSGPEGLKGIPCRRENIIRPIIDLSRDEIEVYLSENSIEFMTDETNFETIYTRNRLRLDVIPYIQKNINSNFTRRIVENSDIISEENDFIQGCAENVFSVAYNYSDGVHSLNTAELFGCHTAVLRRVFLLYFCKVYNTTQHIERKFIDAAITLMRGQSGKSLNFPKNIILTNGYGIISARENVQESRRHYKIIKTYNVKAEKPSAKAVFIRPQFAKGISLRYKHDGDYFYPYGMEGRKKLKNLFSDIKLPAGKRSSVPLVVSENDEIIWVAGIRADRRFLAEYGELSVKIEVKENDEKSD